MRKIIIVDDEKLLRKGFIHMTDWCKHGFEIVGEAASGAEAMNLVEMQQPDIVVTDIHMPVMNGIELIRSLKTRYPHIGVIVLSSYSDFPYVKESLKLGAADYILKANMTFDEVLQALKKLSGQGTGGHEASPICVAPPAAQSMAFYGELLTSANRHADEAAGSEPFLNDALSRKELRHRVEEHDLSDLYDVVYERVLELIARGTAPEPYELQKSLVEIVYILIHKIEEAGWDPLELQQRKMSFFRQLNPPQASWAVWSSSGSCWLPSNA